MRIKIGTNNLNTAKFREKKLLLIALFCGLLAAGANYYFLTSSTGGSKTLLKAKNDMPVGTKVTRDDFTQFVIRTTEQDFKGIFIESEDFDTFENKSLVVSLRKDDPLLIQSFDPSSTILPPPGKKLLTIRVQDEEQAIGYKIRSGRLVDLYGWINGQQYKLAGNLCVSATGSLTYTPRDDNGSEIRYGSISVLIDEKDVMNLQQNLHLALESVRLTLGDYCDPAVAPFIENEIKPLPQLPANEKAKSISKNVR
jgi:hypothetical protein